MAHDFTTNKISDDRPLHCWDRLQLRNVCFNIVYSEILPVLKQLWDKTQNAR